MRSRKAVHAQDRTLQEAPRLAIMCQKQKGLTMIDENLAKTYIIEINILSSFFGCRWRKNAGGKNEGKSYYVIENK